MPKRPWPIAYVLDAEPQALAMIRGLGRHGVPVICVSHGEESPGRFSRYCASVVLPHVRTHAQAWVEYLVRERRRQAVPAVLIPTTDYYLEFVAAHLKTLSEHYRILAPTGEMLRCVLNKDEQYQRASQAGVPIPQTVRIQDLEGLREAGRRIGFPCLVKPVVSHHWVHAMQNFTKLNIVHSEQDLCRVYERAMAMELPVLVQELIPGSDEHLYEVHFYRDANGVFLGLGVDQKLRQFLPTIGNGTLRITASHPIVAELARRTADALAFTGLGHLEFRFDPRDARFKLMELNGRATSGLSLMSASGIDLPWIAYRDVIGQPVAASTSCRPGVKWWYCEGDYQTYRIYRREGRLTLGSWLRSLWGVRSFAWFAWDDPRPFIKAVRRFVWRLRHRKLFPIESALHLRSERTHAGMGARHASKISGVVAD